MTQHHLFQEPDPAEEGSGGFVPVSSLVAPGNERAKAGIARMAAEAAALDFRNEVDYRDLPCRTLVTSVASARVPFTFAINPYRGCEFGCTYCYARYTHEYMEL